MRVHLLRADAGGSDTYRMSEPGRAVADAFGVDVTIDDTIDIRGVMLNNGEHIVDRILNDYDVLVLQRPVSQRHYALAVAAKRQRIAVVAELDDDFHNVHPGNVAAASTDPANDPWHNRNWLVRTLELADLVTVSTPILLKYARLHRKPGLVVRNYLPARALEIAPADPRPHTVGWTGTVRTHPADLQRARGVLARTDRPVAVVGDKEGVAAALSVPPDRVQLAVPWTATVGEYWQAVRDHIGIGIAPLESSKFNQAKSWLKPMEYAAFGIPFVASPTGEYRRIVAESGAGIIAHSPGTWSKAVEAISHQDLYETYAAAGRQWVEANTLETHAHEWYDAWKTAEELR